MEIITRQEAIRRHLSKYFTGEPCKNGHIAARYLQSSTCEQCINGSPHIGGADYLEIETSKIALRQEKLRLETERLKLSAQRLAQRSKPKRTGMVEIKLGIHYEDLKEISTIIVALCRIHEPSLLESDILSKKEPKPWGKDTWLRTFSVFPEDVGAITYLSENYKYARLTPEQQREVWQNQPRRMDGWVPPTPAPTAVLA